ncbi:MAG: hypothetical protein KBT04_02805 [Bacteroidales bacterium]|nr:hypothetical protein [Candidatus Colimorpha onthohippi]
MNTIASQGAVANGCESCTNGSIGYLLDSAGNHIPQWEDIGLEDLLVVINGSGITSPVVIAGRVYQDSNQEQVVVEGVRVAARRVSVKRLFASRAIDVYLYCHCQLRL